jgi:hypothetical protein
MSWNFDLEIEKSELIYNDKSHVICVNSLQMMITWWLDSPSPLPKETKVQSTLLQKMYDLQWGKGGKAKEQSWRPSIDLVGPWSRYDLKIVFCISFTVVCKVILRQTWIGFQGFKLQYFSSKKY